MTLRTCRNGATMQNTERMHLPAWLNSLREVIDAYARWHDLKAELPPEPKLDE